jgi:phosphomannomutase
MFNPKIFKAYDVRGIYPTELDEETAYKVGQAYAKFIKPKKVAIGRDVRSHGENIKKELIRGLNDAGVDVTDIGIISTDMLYFAVANYGYDGGITVSASHNPKEYNGFKFVREKSIAISSDTGLFDIRDMVVNNNYEVKSDKKGTIEKKEIMDDYIEKIITFIDVNKIKPLKVVLSANFGLAGKVAKKILEKIPAKIEATYLDDEPNGDFPKGRPDPLITERQTETSELVKSTKSDFGVAWDADADRCFFFDETGKFVEGYFIVGLLAKELLKNHPGDKILHDPRLTWATIETVKKSGGIPIVTKTGHGFIKDRMKKEDALFAGEMSAHNYFRDYYYCDNGMIPLVMMMQMISETGQTLSELIAPMTHKYFVSGEINNEVKDVDEVLQAAEKIYSDGKIDKTDGLSVEYGNPENDKICWRFNLRGSNTEPKIRLNVESTSKELMEQKRDELLELIEKYK